MKLVTYNGPEDKDDTATELIVPGVSGSFKKGRARVVEDKDAATLENVEGHKFSVKAAPKGAKPDKRGIAAAAADPADTDSQE